MSWKQGATIWSLTFHFYKTKLEIISYRVLVVFLTRFRFAEIKRQKREKASPGVHNMYLIHAYVKTQRKIKNYFVDHVIFFGHIIICYIPENGHIFGTQYV